MATKTDNLGLIMPDPDEYYDINVFNKNTATIENAFNYIKAIFSPQSHSTAVSQNDSDEYTADFTQDDFYYGKQTLWISFDSVSSDEEYYLDLPACAADSERIDVLASCGNGEFEVIIIVRISGEVVTAHTATVTASTTKAFTLIPCPHNDGGTVWLCE